jgi:hypothetical protein
MTKAPPIPESGAEVIPLPIGKKERRRAEHKFGAPVMKHGYTMLPNLLLRAQGRLNIGHAEFNVLVHLVEHWWDADKNPYPAKELIARRMGVSPRTIPKRPSSSSESSATLVIKVKRRMHTRSTG